MILLEKEISMFQDDDGFMVIVLDHDDKIFRKLMKTRAEIQDKGIEGSIDGVGLHRDRKKTKKSKT